MYKKFGEKWHEGEKIVWRQVLILVACKIKEIAGDIVCMTHLRKWGSIASLCHIEL